MSNVTFYPDAHPETNSVDGHTYHDYGLGAGQDWATIVAAVGNGASDSAASFYAFLIEADNVNNKWQSLIRGVLLFNTAGIPDTAVVVSARLTLYGNSKSDGLSCTPDLNIYAIAPASNTAVAAGDFDSFGTTPYCDTPVTYANLNVFSPPSTFGTVIFDFNPAGLLAISLTGVTKIGLRNANKDVAGVAPTWGSEAYSHFAIFSADDTTERRPKLEVVYNIPTKSLQRITGLTHIADRTRSPNTYLMRVYIGGLVPSIEAYEAEQEINKKSAPPPPSPEPAQRPPWAQHRYWKGQK